MKRKKSAPYVPSPIDPRALRCPCGNGKAFAECHGLNAARPVEAPPTIVLDKPPVTRKLDLACGQNKREGFEGVDWIAAPGVDIVHDLTVFPWPIESNSIAELHTSHFIEHIPMTFVDTSDGKKDALLAFFDECYRILVPDGLLTAIWPALQSTRAFQDPTHRRFIPAELTYYLHSQWRRNNKLDHYNVKCDFECAVEWSCDAVLNTRTDEVKMNHFRHEWGWQYDFISKCKAIKPAR